MTTNLSNGKVQTDSFVNSAAANRANFLNLTSAQATIGDLTVGEINGVPFPNVESFDYIVVGAGTAGSILADYLSRSGQNSVLVVESGRNNELDPTFNLDVDPANQSTGAILGNYNQGNKFVDFISGTQDGSSFGFRNVGFGGKGWGGSSGHNYIQAVRPSPEYFADLAALVGDSNWNYANSVPLLEAVETYLPYSGSGGAARGSSGPISIFQPGPADAGTFAAIMTPVMAASIGGVSPSDAGIQVVNDYNNGQNICVSENNQYFASNPGGDKDAGPLIRSYGGNDIIQPILADSSRNLTLVSKSEVTSLVMDGTTVIGVMTVDDGENRIEYRANNKVILCAGTLRNPNILERSGIGSSAVLSQYDIPVVVENDNVGENLKNHPLFFAIAEVASTTIGSSFARNGFFSPMTFAYGLTPKPSRRQLQLITSAGTVGLFNGRDVGIRAEQGWPDFPPTGATTTQLLGTFILDNEGTGSCHISGKSLQFGPVIQYTNFGFSGAPDVHGPTPTLADLDSQRIIAAYTIWDAAITAAGYTMLYPSSAQVAAADVALVNIARSIATNSGHWSGTCKMDNDPSVGVVDSNLHVHGVDNLMIADTSIFPIIPDANTCYSAYYAGVQAARVLGVF